MSWYKESKKQITIEDLMNTGRSKEKNITEKDVDPKELKKGIEIEYEHIKDKKIAKKIALDHLAEIPNYYRLLTAMEKAGENAKDDGLSEGLCPFVYTLAKKYVKLTKNDWNYITPEELKKKGLDKFFILDVRKPDAFKKGHLKGAVNIFWLDLFEPKNLKKLPLDKKILVYCYVGHTSSQVLVFLKLLGYDVVSLKYGMGISPVEGIPVAGWTDFGFEIVK